jgi:hypothetical protein
VEKFERLCRNELRAYQVERAVIQHEWTNLSVKIICTIGGAVSGAGSGVVQKFLGLGSLETVLLLGGIIFPFAGKYLPEIRNRLKAERDLHTSAGYGLATPYRSLLR